MAGAAQIQTRLGSLIAGVRISPRAEERAVVKRKSELICMLDYVTCCKSVCDLRDKGFHARRRSCICQLIRRDIAETLAQSSEGDVGNLPPDADIGDGVAGRCILSAGGNLVDLPLDQSAENTRESGD